MNQYEIDKQLDMLDKKSYRITLTRCICLWLVIIDQSWNGQNGPTH